MCARRCWPGTGGGLRRVLRDSPPGEVACIGAERDATASTASGNLVPQRSMIRNRRGETARFETEPGEPASTLRQPSPAASNHPQSVRRNGRFGTELRRDRLDSPGQSRPAVPDDPQSVQRNRPHWRWNGGSRPHWNGTEARSTRRLPGSRAPRRLTSRSRRGEAARIGTEPGEPASTPSGSRALPRSTILSRCGETAYIGTEPSGAASTLSGSRVPQQPAQRPSPIGAKRPDAAPAQSRLRTIPAKPSNRAGLAQTMLPASAMGPSNGRSGSTKPPASRTSRMPAPTSQARMPRSQYPS